MFPATDPSVPRDYLPLPAEPETGKRCPAESVSLSILRAGWQSPLSREGVWTSRALVGERL